MPIVFGFLCFFTPVKAADLILKNGTIYTVNEDQPLAEAMAVKDGKIVFVGSNEEVEQHLKKGTKVVDLEGRFVMPGIHDVHTHPLEANNPAAASCLLTAGVKVSRQLGKIKRCARRNKSAEWVTGWGYYIDDIVGETRPPVELLDEAVPDRPAIMMEFTSHSMWVNSKALELAKITADTPNPPGGIIVKDKKTGKPNGILIDNAGNMMKELQLKPTAELLDQAYDGLKIGLRKLASNGITSIADARVYWTRGHHKVWQRAERENVLTARVVMSLWGYPQFGDEQISTLKAMYSNEPGRLLRATQIKIYADGITGVGSAAMKQPYLYDYGFISGNRGLNYFSQERMTKYITELETVGFDFHIHTIGDRGVHEALNAVEAAAKVNKSKHDRRHRLTHVELTDKKDHPRFKQLNVIADFQVAGDWTNIANYKRDSGYLLGSRANFAIPLKSIYEAGALITLSSDYDVSTINPFVGMQNALTRKIENLPDIGTVIEAYTINGAYALRQEKTVGSLEVGKFADLVVLDQNLLEIAPNKIRNTKVLWTLLAGEEVYRHPSYRGAQ
ncbi:MAG: amidohydrolase [Blastopirellula sp.]|nr:MAG: amidohydrolase [Blastopirellula sp.]